MRSFIPIALLLSKLAVAAPADLNADVKELVPRQILSTLGGMMMGKVAASKIEEIPSQFPKEKGAKRIRVTLGPYSVEPGNAKHKQGPGKMDKNSQQITQIATGLPQDVLILSTESKMTYADGTEADINNGYYNHHYIIMDANKMSLKTQFACDNGKNAGMPVAPFAGASESNRDLYFVSPENKFNGGYYIGKGDAIMISAEVVNYTNDTKTLYSVSEMEYVPGRPKGALDVSLQVIDVGACVPATNGMMAGMVMPPKDKKTFSLDSRAVTVQQDGSILYRRGHMHDGGDAVVMKVNGKSICESTATYGGKTQTAKGADGKVWDTISAMKGCRDVVSVKKGDKITIEAKFDLEKHPAREENVGDDKAEQMGLMTFMFAPAAK